MTASRWLLAGALGVAALLVLVAPGCNLVLGIEEQGRRPITATDATVAETGVTTGPCTQDADCVAPDACYTAHCDTSTGRCWNRVCEVAGKACSAGTCNPTTRACEGTTDYGFRTTSYPVIAPGCADAGECVAAIWPFLFVGTPGGVTAMYVDDPLAKGARTIPVSGFEGAVGKLVASGSRLWILGTPEGGDGGTTMTVALGFIDVPTSTTTLERLDATTSRFDEPLVSMTAFAAPKEALYVALALGPGAAGFPNALITPPLPARGRFVLAGAGGGGDAIELRPASDVPQGASGLLVGSSGERLVVHEFPSTYFMITGPGTPAPKAEARIATTFAPAVSFPSFAQGRQGALVSASIVHDDPPNDCGCSSVARMRWLFASKDDRAIDQTTAIDVERYRNEQSNNQPCHTCLSGYFVPPVRAVWLDDNTALVAAPAKDPNRARTAVRAVTRSPAERLTGRRFVVPPEEASAGTPGADRLAFTADKGIGFLVITDVMNRARLSIFDARCQGTSEGE